MKKWIFTIIALFFFVSAAHAFLYEIKILSKGEIEALSNDVLMDTYIEAVIERRASETFHGRAGFAPKEYNSFKDLLGYIIRLRQEMNKREMDVPPLEEWIR